MVWEGLGRMDMFVIDVLGRGEGVELNGERD